MLCRLQLSWVQASALQDRKVLHISVQATLAGVLFAPGVHSQLSGRMHVVVKMHDDQATTWHPHKDRRHLKVWPQDPRRRDFSIIRGPRNNASNADANSGERKGYTAAGHIVWPKSETLARPRGRALSQLLAACIEVKGHLCTACFFLTFSFASSLNCCRE